MPDARQSGQWVRLVKTEDLFGVAPIGKRVEYRFDPEVPADDLMWRALRRLKRDLPDENPLCWKAVD